MGEQVPLFAGNRGCGVRDRGAVFVEIAKLPAGEAAAKERCVVLRLNGVKLESPNRSFQVSRGGRMAQASKAKKIRRDVALHIVAALGRDHAAPSRVVITRVSSGTLDRDNVWASTKPVWDGVADAFGLANDRELQERGDVAQAKSKPKTFGLVIELFFAV